MKFIVRKSIDHPGSPWEVIPRNADAATNTLERQVFPNRREARLYRTCREASLNMREASRRYAETP